MATNPYFNNIAARNEQNLAEDLVIETIKIKGMDMFYLPRTLVNQNPLYGEDPNSAFLNHHSVEMYLENVNGFQGQQDLLSKLGLQIKDTAILIVSKARFQKETGMARPMEGDIIYLPLTKGFFEIKYVEHESPFFQMGKNYVFRMSLELFEFSQETFETGEPELDEIVKTVDYTLFATVTGGTGVDFVAGDRVYQYTSGSSITGGTASANAFAVVRSVNGSTVTLQQASGGWNATSGNNIRYITKFDGTSYRILSGLTDSIDISEYDDNKTVEDRGDTYLNTTKTNPFGTP